MFKYLMGILSSEIEINVSPNYFSFSRKGREINFKTVIYISIQGKPRVLGVGEDLMPPEENVKIDLFKSGDIIVGYIDKAECLDAFLRYCIAKTVNRNLLIRPRIVFKNVASLDSILCGYQKMVLKNVAINAGARECLIED